MDTSSGTRKELRILRMLRMIGPGIIIAASIIGPGTVTTSSSTGASYGYALLWCTVLTPILAYILEEPGLRWTLKTNTTMLEGVRTQVSPLASKITFIALFVGALAYQTGNYVGAAMAINLLIPGLSITGALIILCIASLIIAFVGKYKLLEQVNMGLVLIMLMAFLITMFASKPSISGIASGLIPSIPTGAQLLALGLVGTTMCPDIPFALSSLTKRKWNNGLGDLKKAKGDLKFNMVLTGVITCAIIICSATVLYPQGITVSSAADMAQQLVPVLGRFAGVLFALREAMNTMYTNAASGANALVQDKYYTVSAHKKNIEEARSYFARIGADLTAHFARLGSKCVEVNHLDRLRIFHSFYRSGEEADFHFNLSEAMRKGHSFKDTICPDTLEFDKDYFVMGNRYGRVMFLREYANYIKDSMISEIMEMNRNMVLSIDIIPVPTDEAVRMVENTALGIETNIANWQRKQNQNNNFSAIIPYDMEQQRGEAKEFMKDLTSRDQRMMFAVVTLVHTADSLEELNSDTEAILSTTRKHVCQFASLKYQQMDGLNTVLPFGVRKIHALRTFTTESLAALMPFRVREISHQKGIYYGQNIISKNMIIADRRQLLNGNSFILGVPGSGKSFTAKAEMVSLMLASDADILVIDPEREYSPLVRELGGEVIHISSTSENHINAMDLNREYGDGANPVILKSEFLLSLCEQLIGGAYLGAKQKSLIDRCTANVYRHYQQGNYMGTPPTLQDFREELMRQREPEAQDIALAIELFTDGSLNTFAKQTNVDIRNRMVCYDILDLGKQLMPIGMLVVLDNILNRITQNRAKGRSTFIFIDEIYILFQHEYSANFLFTLWKRVRKYGAFATGITQNVDDLLQSHTARTMLANSEFIVMLNQGQQIGGMGETGRARGVHLHFEIWQGGGRVDPLPYFSNYTTAW